MDTYNFTADNPQVQPLSAQIDGTNSTIGILASCAKNGTFTGLATGTELPIVGTQSAAIGAVTFYSALEL